MSSLIPQPSVDYTDKDFDALRERLIKLVRSVFPQWTDQNVLTFGNIMIELFAFVGDVLTFYQDSQAAEAFIPTATQRRSIINLSKLIGFELPGASAATAETKLSLTSGVTPGTVTFPAGTVVRTREIADPIKFQLLTAAVIGAAADPPEVLIDVEHSENRQETHSSNDLPDQAFILSGTPYLDNTLAVTTSQGSWTEVDSFLDSLATDRHFTVEVDQNDRATFRFGDGTNGLIPIGTITADYKIGGGEDGNVEASEIQVVEGVFQDSLGNPVSVIADNALKASGGGPRMTVAAAKVAAPLSLRVLNRTVAREDYEINALKVDGVARALMLTSDQEPLIAENAGFLHIIPDGGGQPTQTLKDNVLDKVTVEFPNTITFKTFVDGTDYLDIDIQATVYLRQGYNAATVKADIEQALTDFFAITNADGTPNTNVDFGYNYKDADGNPAGEVSYSDIYNVVRDVTGVRKIGDKFEDFLVNGSDRDVLLPLDQFPVLATVTLKNGDTGLPL